MEIRSNRESNSAAAWEPPQSLALGSEIVMLDGSVLLGRLPAQPGRVLGADAPRPGQGVVDLDEVVVARVELVAAEAGEELAHAGLELFFELWHVAAGVNVRHAHAELVLEAPEPGEEDGPGEQIVLAVWLFDHKGQVILNEASCHAHGIFLERSLRDVERLSRPQILDSDVGAPIQRRIPIWEIIH